MKFTFIKLMRSELYCVAYQIQVSLSEKIFWFQHVRWNDLVYLSSTVSYNCPYIVLLRLEIFVRILYILLSFWNISQLLRSFTMLSLNMTTDCLFRFLCLFCLFLVQKFFAYFVHAYYHFKFSRSSCGFLSQHSYCQSHWQ